MVVENAHRLCGVAGEIAAIVSEDTFEHLKKPIQRLTAPNGHAPFSPALEKLMYPTKEKIIAAVQKIV